MAQADFEQLMNNPYFQIGARMMAANQGKGMAAGPAFGGAAMGTAADLAATRKAAAKRSREEKALDLTEKRLAETSRANLAKEKMYSTQPTPMGTTGKYWTPAHGVQGGSMDPLTMMMMMQGGGGLPLLPGGGAPSANSDEAKRQALKSMNWGAPPAAPAPMAAPATMPPVSTRSGAPAMPNYAGIVPPAMPSASPAPMGGAPVNAPNMAMRVNPATTLNRYGRDPMAGFIDLMNMGLPYGQ